MKTFITFAIVCLIANSLGSDFMSDEDQTPEVKAFFEECVKQEKLSPDDITKLHKEDYSNPSPSMKCFGTCFFEKIGVLKDGVLQEAALLKMLTPDVSKENIKTVLGKCKNTKGADRCDTGYKIFKCFEDNLED